MLVVEAMMKCLTREGNFRRNPASRSHVFGWKAEVAVEQAREQVAQLINADPARSFGPVAPLSRTTWPSGRGPVQHQTRQAHYYLENRAQSRARYLPPIGA